MTRHHESALTGSGDPLIAERNRSPRSGRNEVGSSRREDRARVKRKEAGHVEMKTGPEGRKRGTRSPTGLEQVVRHSEESRSQ